MKRGRGRPPRAGEPAQHTVKCTVTTGELQMIYGLADAVGCPVADVVRIALLEFAASRRVAAEMPLTGTYDQTGFSRNSTTNSKRGR